MKRKENRKIKKDDPKQNNKENSQEKSEKKHILPGTVREELKKVGTWQ
jgi:hypothetical protein